MRSRFVLHLKKKKRSPLHVTRRAVGREGGKILRVSLGLDLQLQGSPSFFSLRA